jgi:heme A synthase
VLAQVAVGETQYRTQLPWWLVLIHVLLAAGVWAGSVGLAAVLFRPPLPVAQGRDAHKLRQWPARSASPPARASATRS